ncbi:MAG: molecular chaperone DnaJ [Pseudomonadota bacterium]
MKNPPSNSVRIAEAGATAPQSRVRKQFNTLIKKLEAERARLAAWHEALPVLQNLVEHELAPLEETLDTHRRELVLLFDRAYPDKIFGKKDKEKLADLICSIGLDLLDFGDDAELKAVCAKYDVDFDADEDETAMFKNIMETMTGMPLGEDVDWRSPEALAAVLSEKMAEMEAEAEKQEQARQERAAKRPKSAKTLEKEARQHAEEQRLQQSVREIYRKLASALHPDKEPDAAERERKTALMQRVNAAYAANDVLALLELQLEIEQISQAGLDSLDEGRIKQYNKILTDQVRELEAENIQIEYMMMREMDGPGRPSPQRVLHAARTDIVETRVQIDNTVRDLADFQDPKALKAWLKTYRIPERDDFYGDGWF